MKRFAMVIVAALASLVSLMEVKAAPGSDNAPVLTVKNGLSCWFDAAAGVTANADGVVQQWKDLSGNGHHATLAAGAPVLAANQLKAKPTMQFRTEKGACGFNLDGPFFVEEQFVVVRSPNVTWMKDGCFLGRRWARASSYRLGAKGTAFWGDQYAAAVSKNGKKLGQPFDLAPITEFMILKIDVNDGDMSNNTYQIGIADMASCDFDVAEIIGFQSKLSPADEASVGSYLAAKYGISTTYPAYSTLPLTAAAAGNYLADKYGINNARPTATPDQQGGGSAPKLPVTKGLACWFDAAQGLAANAQGEIETWKDLSGNSHNATVGAGATVRALNQPGVKPAVQFRKSWLALAGTFFAKEHYLVLRSPSAQWNGSGGFLGRLKGRGSSYNTWGRDTGFWTDQSPLAVSRNGIVLPGPAFDCSPLGGFMILKIVVNDGSTTPAAYAIGNNDGMAACDFDVAEILGYESMLSPADEALVGGYLSAKYGIRSAYPPLPGEPKPLAPGEMAAVKYKGWQHSGSLWLLTTPEGANLPATAVEENFPLLVRLNKEWFNFAMAKANGEDVRFSTAAGVPLACQIDHWDAAAGTAGIWVRVPTVKGNARQEIKMYWGQADAASESSGAAVFNASNGYLSVWHMNDPVKDDAGTLESQDLDTASTSGMIGRGRKFSGGKGINGGAKITTYPFVSSPHTSEAWFKADKLNTTILNWGKSDTVNLRLLSTPSHLAVATHSGVLHATSVIPKGEWVQVVHTYNGQFGQIYVNGQPDTAAPAPSTMRILTPVQVQIGGGFAGDMDEVRISKVARSADWVKLQYENQKPHQTAVGPLVRPGNEFSVSEKSINLSEGKSLTVTAKAGGAQKLYWIIKSATAETIAAIDQFNFTLDAGRVTGDQSFTLQCKAVFADGVKTMNIPVKIREEIPDPIFTLKAPAKWDGREAIEVVPQISNLAAMQAKGAGELKYDWTLPPMVESREIAAGKLILKRARNSGLMTLTASVSNGGKAVTQTISIIVTEPKTDPWVVRVPEKDEKPVDGQFYARDDKNEGTLFYNGTLTEAADSVFLKVYADDKLLKTEIAKPAADKSYALTAKLKPGLIKYKVEFGTKAGGKETLVQTVTNLVCGDAYIIEGQSNALATDTGEKSPPETSEWIRSYGRAPNNPKEVAGTLWCYPVWKAEKGEKAELGWWGMELAKRLLESQKVPIFIINGAAGGTRIDQHQRNDADPTDVKTIYGRLLWRVQQAKMTHGIRGILWHQGESDQGLDGPDGGYGWETYQQYFFKMSADWKRDFPNLRHTYIYQIWPNSCSMGNGHGDMLREVLRTLPQHYSHMSIMSTLGIKPPGGCHYPLLGWAEFARLIQPLIERDNYGKVPTASITPPNLVRAKFNSAAKDTLALEFDQPIVWADALAGQFYLDGEKDKVASGAVSGNILTLTLKAPTTATKLTYLKETAWSQDKLIRGTNGIAALTFCDVGIAK